MNKKLKRILVASASFLMLASVGVGINNVQAKHYHHIRTHRTYHYSGWHKGLRSDSDF